MGCTNPDCNCGEKKVTDIVDDLLEMGEEISSEHVFESRFAIDEPVILDFYAGGILRYCAVAAVSFMKGKVYYDVDVHVGEGCASTTIMNVDSAFVKSPSDAFED